MAELLDLPVAGSLGSDVMVLSSKIRSKYMYHLEDVLIMVLKHPERAAS